MIRRTSWRLFAVLLILGVMLLIYPVRNGITRPALVLVFPLLYMLLLGLLWRIRVVRYLLIVLASPVIVLLLPGPAFDPVALQSRYVSSLRSYEGTKYVWGGENHLGVDCSGLVRAAMVDAEFHEGCSHVNPRLLREACWLWWHDIAAKDMPKGYAGRMDLLFTSDEVRTTGMGQLRQGDVAVTGDGSHVIAFVGEDRWIEADPIGLRVCEWRADDRPTSIDRPMIFLRWKAME